MLPDEKNRGVELVTNANVRQFAIVWQWERRLSQQNACVPSSPIRSVLLLRGVLQSSKSIVELSGIPCNLEEKRFRKTGQFRLQIVIALVRGDTRQPPGLKLTTY